MYGRILLPLDASEVAEAEPTSSREGEQRALADYLAEVSNLTTAWARLRQRAE